MADASKLKFVSEVIPETGDIEKLGLGAVMSRVILSDIVGDSISKSFLNFAYTVLAPSPVDNVKLLVEAKSIQEIFEKLESSLVFICRFSPVANNVNSTSRVAV